MKLALGEKSMAAYLNTIIPYEEIEQHDEKCDWHENINSIINFEFMLDNKGSAKSSNSYYLLDMSKQQGFRVNPRNCGIIKAPLTC
jgi:hypothetical protein